MELLEMIVTDADGKTDKVITTNEGKQEKQSLNGQMACIQDSDGRPDMYRFYAMQIQNPYDADMNTAPKASIITMVIPLGGNMTGLYRFPHIGDKVLVGSSNGNLYMMGYLPNSDTPFNKEKKEASDAAGKEDTTVIDQDAQVFRYRKTGTNTRNGQSDEPYSEIGFYSETTEWLDKKSTSKPEPHTEKETGLPIVDKIKISSTGDIEQKAQNYNEFTAERIGIFAGYNDDISNLKKNQKEQLKNQPQSPASLSPLPQDSASEDPAFFRGDIQVRAKQRIVLKAEKGIEIVVGRSLIKIDDTGISLVSRKTSGSSVNAWDSAITLASRDGLSMFGQKVNISSALKFSITESFGGDISSMGGIMRINAHDLKMTSICKAAYVVKGTTASASFATNIASMSMGIDQNRGKSDLSSLSYSIPSYFSLGAGVVGTLIGVNWKYASSSVDAEDAAGSMLVITDLIMTIMGLVTMVLEKVFIPQPNQDNGGRDGLTFATTVAEYGLVLQMFIRLNLACLAWMNKAVYMMNHRCAIYESCQVAKRYSVRTAHGKSPLAGGDTMFITDLWRGFTGQAKWKIVLESIAALALVGGIGVGAAFGYLNKSDVDAETRKELELL